MTSADSLSSHDRCARKSFLEKDWERNHLHPGDVLRRAIDVGLESEEEDPGIAAGDEVMTLCTERGMDTGRGDLYAMAQHTAALADIIVWFLRGTGKPWERPEDVKIGKSAWESSTFLSACGTRLRRVAVASRWGEDRALGESHSWRTVGETTAYGIPITQIVVIVGQTREGRYHSPWTKAFCHPVNHSLRMRKRSGENFGGKWRSIWREETEYSREKWLDAMTDDGILGDVVFEVEVPVPEAPAKAKISWLMEKKLAEIKDTTELPPPCPSVCDWPVPCDFSKACWHFELPSSRNGFIQITT